MNECVFIYLTYHTSCLMAVYLVLSEIERQLVKAPLAAAISPLISLTHPTHAWNER